MYILYKKSLPAQQRETLTLYINRNKEATLCRYVYQAELDNKLNNVTIHVVLVESLKCNSWGSFNLYGNFT